MPPGIATAVAEWWASSRLILTASIGSVLLLTPALKALPFKAAFTAMFGDEKVQFDPDGVACEIWADRVELWMGDGRAIRVPRHELMGSQEKKRGGYVTIAYEMGRGKRVKGRVPREAACG